MFCAATPVDASNMYFCLCDFNQLVSKWIMYVFPVPADPVIKKNGYFLRFIGLRLAVMVFMMLYCSSGRLIIVVCGKIVLAHLVVL